MKVNVDSTRIIKPIYEGINPPTCSNSIPLSVFDKVTYNSHMPLIFAYRPPVPPNYTIEIGLQRVLSEYRECAGRLGENEKGELVIFLNDEGVKFVEASVDSELDQVLPLEPSSVLLSLHPSLKDVEELMQVQVTRFTCGSLVVGFTHHHFVVDGQSASSLLVAWGKASRGLDFSPLPTHDRTIFNPRKPPRFEFEHRGVEFTSKNKNKDCSDYKIDHDIVVHKVHFPLDFLSELKARTSSSSNNKPYTTFESLVAHLWRIITKARGLEGFEKTHVRISVNGRMRMDPRVANEYFGNLVLWTYPTTRVKDLIRQPLPYAAKIIHDAIANSNDSYFRSFIDFAIHKVETEDLVPTADMNKSVLWPNVDVDSWLKFPFYDFDFGGGKPFIFMPSYLPTEGLIILSPSNTGDGSVDAFVSLFRKNSVAFKQLIYSPNLINHFSL